MSTTKQRINITADRDVEFALRSSAKRDRMPIASKAAELLRLALSIEEDLALATIVRQREKKHTGFIPHKKVWDKLLG